MSSDNIYESITMIDDGLYIDRMHVLAIDECSFVLLHMSLGRNMCTVDQFNGAYKVCQNDCHGWEF